MAPRSIRRRPILLDEDDGPAEGYNVQSVEDTKLLQKLRQKQSGLDASILLQRQDDDGVLGSTLATGAGQTDGNGLHAVFKKERQMNEGSEDPHMKEYVEAQLAARLGRSVPQHEGRQTPKTLEDEILADSKYQRKDDLELGPSWVAGITEVPLSLDQKLRNIEATEKAKQQVLADSGISRGDIFGDDDDENQAGGLVNTDAATFPVFFGKQDPALLQRIQEARAAKKRKQAYYAELRAKKKQEDRPSW